MTFYKRSLWVLTAFFGLLFMLSGVVMITQGYAAKTEVKNEIAAEKLTIPAAERPDGSRDEVVLKEVPAEYRGAAVTDAAGLRYMRAVIRGHTLNSTGGKTFSEMPRTIPKLDEAGNPVLDEDGKSVMVPNTARDLWITSTTLQTALMQGYLALKVADLVTGVGALAIALGAAMLFVLTPVAFAKKTQGV